MTDHKYALPPYIGLDDVGGAERELFLEVLHQQLGISSYFFLEAEVPSASICFYLLPSASIRFNKYDSTIGCACGMGKDVKTT